MTSGVFNTCPLDQIIINRDERQRKDISDVEDLKDSIRRLGLIHPPVITRDYILVAGERRMTALKQLGWDSVPFQFVDEIDPIILHGIQLEENIKRKNLPWQDEMNAIDVYDLLRRSEDRSWNQDKTGAAIGVDQTTISRTLKVAEALRSLRLEPERRHEILNKKTFSEARHAIEFEEQLNKKARKLEYDMVDMHDAYPPYHILNTRFEDWLTEYTGPTFDFIHCDFPYGIGFDRMGSQAGSTSGRYEDSPDIYQNLIQLFCTALDCFADDNCHFIFWFSMSSYQYTYDMLTQRANITIDPFPLVWLKSDNTGILPDAHHGPRRIYETAFFGRRGESLIKSARSNAFAYPASEPGKIHPHEKPEEMLKYFFSMFVSSQTSIFDPTCGSGSALRAARSLGANRVLGLEADERFAQLANYELTK